MNKTFIRQLMILNFFFSVMAFSGCGTDSTGAETESSGNFSCTTDLDCNEDQNVSSLSGQCSANGSCKCNDGFELNQKSGKCAEETKNQDGNNEPGANGSSTSNTSDTQGTSNTGNNTSSGGSSGTGNTTSGGSNPNNTGGSGSTTSNNTAGTTDGSTGGNSGTTSSTSGNTGSGNTTAGSADYCVGAFDAKVPSGSLSAVPGVVLYSRESPITNYFGPGRIYTSGTSIVTLPNGDYLFSFGLFGKSLVPSSEDSGTTYIYRSSDKGKTWKNLTPKPMMNTTRSSLFIHKGILYMFAYTAAPGKIIIKKSTDNGETWTDPKDDKSGLISSQERSGTPFNVAFHNGRIWAAVGGKRMMSVDENKDLLDADNWSGPSNKGNSSKGPLGSNLVVSEAQIVASKKTGVVIMPKIFGLPNTALIKVVGNDKVEGIADEDWIDLPGGEKKFAAGYDSVTERFYILSNAILPSHDNGFGTPPELVRNTGALLSSKDLRHWDLEKIFIHSSNYNYEAFQYFNFHIDGDDMLVGSRTAFDIGNTPRPPRGHDSNLATFHRIDNFRAAKPCQFLRISGDKIMRYELTQHEAAPFGSFVIGTSFNGQKLGQINAMARGQDGNVLIQEKSGRILKFDALGNFLEVLKNKPAGSNFQKTSMGISQAPKGERAWTGSKNNEWNKIDNWYYWGRVDTNYEIANFGSAISSNTKIEMDKDFTAKGIRFRNESSYEISGSGSIIIESDKGNGIIDLKLGQHILDVNLKLESDTDMSLNEKTKLSLKEPVNLNKKSLSIKGKGSMQIENSFQMKGGIIIHDGLALVSFNSVKSIKLDGNLKFEPDSSINLKEGLSFKLFEIKQAINDSFNKLILPKLSAGLKWDSSELYNKGELRIIAN